MIPRLLARSLLAAASAFAAGTAATAEPMIDFVVARADTLIGLSKSVLVAPDAWREVARINKLSNANRIRPGQHLLIPARLMRSEVVGATLVSVSGDVQLAGAPAVAGATVAEGQSVQTGAAGSAVIALADGSQVRIPPSSLAEVAASRSYGRPKGTATVESSGWFAGTMRVLRGSVEVFATKVLRAKPLEVITPTAVVGVRGTRYRVGFDDDAKGLTHAEVIEGKVRFDPPSGPSGSDLPGGFGAAADARASGVIVAALLPAPDLASVPARFERPVVRFQLDASVSNPLRVQVASDAAFEKMMSDQVVPIGTEVRIAGLDDAAWFVRARRIDTQGIEGFDATSRFVLKARPEPPAYRAPRTAAKQPIGSIEFSWAQNTEATAARWQIAEDPAFTRIVQERDNIDTAGLRADLTTPGDYFWRVASIRADGDHGPFGDPQALTLRPMPEPPSGGPSPDGSALVFRWDGRAEDRFEVQLARDLAFTDIVASADVSTAEWSLPMPSRSGRYYFRYRSIEPDGFVSPFSDKATIEVPRDWRGLGLLLPLLFLL
jgi:hypothetical protein